MSSYTHFTLEERKYLQQLLSEGKSLRKIAAILERSPSSVSREIARNRTRSQPKHKPDNPYWYNHWRAQILSIGRRRNQCRRALQPGSQEWEFIVNGLLQYWSPEAIARCWNNEHPLNRIAFATIYRAIRNGFFKGITPKSHLRRRTAVMAEKAGVRTKD